MTNYVLAYLLLSLIGIILVISSHRLDLIALTTRPGIVQFRHREAVLISSSIWSRAEPPSGMCDLFCPASAGPIRSGLISSCAYCARPSFGLGVIFRGCLGAGAGGSSCFGLGSGLHRLSHLSLCSGVARHWRCSSLLGLRCFGCLSFQAPCGTLMLMLSSGLGSLVSPAPAHCVLRVYVLGPAHDDHEIHRHGFACASRKRDDVFSVLLQQAELLLSRWKFLRAWDSSLGFPGEGPRKPALSSANRAGVDLTSRNLSYETLEKRRKMLDEFGEFLDSRYGLSVDTLTQQEGKVVARYLMLFGQELFEGSRAQGDFVLAILAVADLERSLRHTLQSAWDMATTWQAITPAENHVPTPPVVLLALVGLSLTWNWRSMCAYLLLAFTGLRRPGEALALRRQDILLPRDLMSNRRCFYIIVQRPKMRRVAARWEHVRVQDPLVLQVMEQWLEGIDVSARLFPISAAYMRVL